MGYTPQPSDSVPPSSPTPSGGEAPTTNADASQGYNRSSLSLETNTGCIRLTPMLSWNYFSLLDSSSYWYERWNNNGPTGFTGNLPKGNAYEVIKVIVPNDGTSNVVGEPTPTTPTTGDAPTSLGLHIQFLNKVSGIGRVRHFSKTYVDKQSSQTPNHNGNWFYANNQDNAWKEMLTTEFATLSNSDTVPNVLIRTNFDYFKCGEDPLNLLDPTTKYGNQNQNLAAEYILTSNFDLPANASFAITYHVYYFNRTQGQDTDPVGNGYFRVYWSKYCFQFNGTEASFCGDTSVGDKTSWVFNPVSGLKTIPSNSKDLITLIFEVVGNSIVITNSIDTGDKDARDKRPSWAWTDLEHLDSSKFGISVPRTNLTIGVRAMDVAFSYIPVVYAPQGKMVVSNSQSGYSITGLTVTGQIDTHEIMGGDTNVNVSIIDASIGSFSYNITIRRGGPPDITPALFSIAIASDPSYTGISIASFPTINRVRTVNANLGQQAQSGSLTLDNRDGALSEVGGIIPCQIFSGWTSVTGGPSVPLQQIFNGFITTANTNKNPNSSFAEFDLVGMDLVLKDAIALNLPIYDGWDSGEAVADLVNRGGWQGQTNIQTGSYQLSVSPNPPSPVFMFPLGKSIMSCIDELATHSGSWAYVDPLGIFNYIQMDPAFGNVIGTYREVPNVNAYDEWLTLGGSKASSDVRNAVLVVGLQMLENNIPIPISCVRTDAGSQVGNYLGDTLIPWLRWQVIQDPKINTVEAAQGIAEQQWQIANRLRIGINGSVWGHPKIMPWSKIILDLKTDNVGVPSNALWRIISVTHSLTADDRSNYTCNIQAEYADPRYRYASFWE